MQIKEALQLQLDAQRRLHEQLEIQRNLQLRIEEQGRQLKMMFDQQQKRNKSFFEMQNANITSPDGPSTSLEDVEILIADGSENTHFPSKIKIRIFVTTMAESADARTERRTSTNDVAQIDTETLCSSGMQIKEALQLQLDIQSRLHKQLEIQRNLQLRIEEQEGQLKMMFDQQQKRNKSFFEMQNASITSPDEPSTVLKM
ncbi:hypothetical protein F0562_015862 [Nyssa sinensis]|uniref:MYB-CC type transcription factor LHEQLE-containing domain-containing protein n=1 Tax=Nyssa sinensis TaxID=561372 RepID=A0A5J4ZI68_9ASTE|nr:hypothetical protein F0562_015862 [Nyssa sinensis]